MTNEVYFGQHIHDLLIDLLYFVYESTFGYYSSLYHFVLAWIVLFVPLLYIGMAILKGTCKSILACYFGMVHKSGMAHKLA